MISPSDALLRRYRFHPFLLQGGLAGHPALGWLGLMTGRHAELGGAVLHPLPQAPRAPEGPAPPPGDPLVRLLIACVTWRIKSLTPRAPEGPARARSLYISHLYIALSLCTTAHPLYTRFTIMFGTPMSEPTMRPNPRSGHSSSRS